MRTRVSPVGSKRFDFVPLEVPDRVEAVRSWSKLPVITPLGIVFAVVVDVRSSLGRGSYHVRDYMRVRTGVEDEKDFAMFQRLA